MSCRKRCTPRSSGCRAGRAVHHAALDVLQEELYFTKQWMFCRKSCTSLSSGCLAGRAVLHEAVDVLLEKLYFTQQ
ncbi:hypothetical protein DPMN_099341 [Dreissena polymorpha]|uniref:Uncharacterized protein n=1 Tax=Dreissena polymorpha TaxID=45954 RepID=A0A9D4LDQ9_DREPO|nr:hypothetical protein DPMN_099341 [Dreissena polymorpha]